MVRKKQQIQKNENDLAGKHFYLNPDKFFGDQIERIRGPKKTEKCPPEFMPVRISTSSGGLINYVGMLASSEYFSVISSADFYLKY